MAKYSWPSRGKASLVGKEIRRTDGIEKTTGAAKYTYDVNLENQLIARALGAPYGHIQIASIDASKAQAHPGVVHVSLLKNAGDEIQWEGELIAVVAAETEGAAAEAVDKIDVKYKKLDVYVDAEDLEGAKKAKRTRKAGGRVVLEREPGDDDDEEEFEEQEIARLMKAADVTVEGYYGIDAITHCCLEPHGSTVHWKGDKLIAYLSTQNVSGTDEQFAQQLGITSDQVEVHCQYIGGGFGSKFAPDYWSIEAAKISKATGRPVKFMLSRDQELKIAGNRPSGYIKVRLGADKKGVVNVWDSHLWGTSGIQGNGVNVNYTPYVLTPPNLRRQATAIRTNAVRQRAWRAPNHPQACAITQTAYDDLAAKLGIDSYDVFDRNLSTAAGAKPEVYREEMKVAAKLMDWKAKWHPHGKGAKKGSVVEGIGMALHTWGGVANNSDCMLRVYPDGGVEAFCGTQDIGTGTRTICAQVVAETFGLEVDQIRINIGTSKLPPSGASGGSTTVGAVCESHRRASQDALEKLLGMAADKLGVAASDLIAKGGKIQTENGGKSLSWKEACALIGMKPLVTNSSFKRGTKSPLSDQTVGGVQMAHVAVDTETGVVRMKKFVAVQDMGLVVNPLTAKAQIYGAVIMGIAYGIYEHRLMDPTTGAFVNAELADYKLPRLGDIGEIVIDLYEPESERSRGVIGLGEPPVISPGAAISNAVCNATGVRVPVLPLTPKRVLEALKKAGRA